MIPSTQTISPLRQRMLDDMRMRKLSPKTQTGYIEGSTLLIALVSVVPLPPGLSSFNVAYLSHEHVFGIYQLERAAWICTKISRLSKANKARSVDGFTGSLAIFPLAPNV